MPNESAYGYGKHRICAKPWIRQVHKTPFAQARGHLARGLNLPGAGANVKVPAQLAGNAPKPSKTNVQKLA